MADRSTPMAADAAAANPNPNWMMLERFVFRRDDDEPFPEEEELVPYTMFDHTFPGDSFSVAFRIAEPPKISRLFLKWERGPKTGPRCVVAAHRNLLLLGLIPDPDPSNMKRTKYSLIPYFEPQRLFLCRPPCSRYDPPDGPLLRLQPIPMCTIPVALRVKEDGTEVPMDRKFELSTVGILSRGEEEFAVAQIAIGRPSAMVDMEAELCVLRSSICSHEHNWEIEKRLSVVYEPDELLDLDAWSTQRVIPFNNRLCWVNYGIGGVLICRVFDKRPIVSYLRLPILNRKKNQRKVLDRNCSLGVTKGATGVDELVFLDVVRKDGYLAGPLTPGTGFTIFYHVLRITDCGGMEWSMTFSLTSAELWDLNKSLRREALTFPHVSMNDPNVLFFLLSENGEGPKGFPNVSVVTLDMSKSEVISVDPYFGERDFSGKDAGMVLRRSSYLESFLPSQLPKFMDPTCEHVLDASPTPVVARPTPTGA